MISRAMGQGGGRPQRPRPHSGHLGFIAGLAGCMLIGGILTIARAQNHGYLLYDMAFSRIKDIYVNHAILGGLDRL